MSEERKTFTVDREKFVDLVHKTLIDRHNGGVLNDECDLLSGAMCAFFSAEEQNSIPPWWVFGPMSGRGVLESLLKAKGKEENEGN